MVIHSGRSPVALGDGATSSTSNSSISSGEVTPGRSMQYLPGLSFEGKKTRRHDPAAVVDVPRICSPGTTYQRSGMGPSDINVLLVAFCTSAETIPTFQPNDPSQRGEAITRQVSSHARSSRGSPLSRSTEGGRGRNLELARVGATHEIENRSLRPRNSLPASRELPFSGTSLTL